MGHPEYNWYQLPARDAIAHGNIKRSNQWPNSSFYTNWLSENDSITFEIEVLEEADYESTIYYTCAKENTGVNMALHFEGEQLNFKISEAHDPPLTGEENDRYKRKVSFVKDFKPLTIGKIHLNKGVGLLTLNALEIPGNAAIDFRLLMLNKK